MAISPGTDQLIIIRIPGNDLIICLHNERQENRAPELVGLLSYVTKRYLHKNAQIKMRVVFNAACHLHNFIFFTIIAFYGLGVHHLTHLLVYHLCPLSQIVMVVMLFCF